MLFKYWNWWVASLSVILIYAFWWLLITYYVSCLISTYLFFVTNKIIWVFTTFYGCSVKKQCSWWGKRYIYESESFGKTPKPMCPQTLPPLSLSLSRMYQLWRAERNGTHLCFEKGPQVVLILCSSKLKIILKFVCFFLNESH